jgi:ankyrin repeat protein
MNDWHQKEQLHIAADEGDLQRVKELVENGYDVNAFDGALSFTPLHYAVKAENIELVRYLLSVGADVNAREVDKIGETPLGTVAASCSYDVAEVLVKAGADPTIPGWMHITALDRAKERTKEEGKRVYELLLNAAQRR